MPPLQPQHVTYKLLHSYNGMLLLPWQQGFHCNKMLPWFAVVPRNMCTKYEVCMLSNSKVMQVLQSVHGSKSYHRLLVPQGTGILPETSYTLKQQSYKHMTMLPW